MPGSTEANVTRIRFVPEHAAEERNIPRRFTQPKAMAAVEEPVEVGACPSENSWPEPIDDLYVIRSKSPLPAALSRIAECWLDAPEHPDAPQAVVIKLESCILRWRPGRAVLEGADATSASLLAGLIDFCFFEGELRRLEQDLLPLEAAASEDVALAYRIRGIADWEQLGETMEKLSRLRLTYARTEPCLAEASRALTPDARRIVARLIVRSGVPARLAAFSNRLEVCEDLYEGAVDRIADFRGYRKGEVLEIIIIVLLLMETIVMIAALFHRP